MLAAFASWCRRLFNTEQKLEYKLKKNPHYPFTQAENVYVLEYRHRKLWVGFLLLALSIIGTATYMKKYHVGRHKHAEYLMFCCFFLSLCLIISRAFCRRLVVDHCTGEYRYFVHTHLRHRGPLNQIYIRMIARKNSLMQQRYKLTLNGYMIEGRDLSGFSEKYEFLESQGKRIATKLNLNYLDYIDDSTRHVVIHRPPEGPLLSVVVTN